MPHKKLLSKIENFKNFALDILFPKKCILCQKINVFLCLNCLSEIKIKERQCCPYCEKITTFQGEICNFCQQKSKGFLDNLVVASFYKDNLKKSIHLFKYNFVEELKNPLSEIMLRSFFKNDMILPDFIVPIPLHKIRKRWRGFNQAELLAEKLAKNLTPGNKIEIFKGLERIRFTPSQMKIKEYSRRKTNLKNAFRLTDKKIIKKKTILLIDDIATSGATLFECAKILKKGGAKKVSAIILARQEMK